MDAFSFPEQASQARLAYWLGRFGFRPTVVERSPAARTGGQAVDVRGGAIDVVEAMGLYDQAHDLRTRMRGSSNALMRMATRSGGRRNDPSPAAGSIPASSSIRPLRTQIVGSQSPMP